MFNAPNIKGPRFRKNHKTLLTKNLFKRFVEANPQYSDLDVDLFKNVVKTCSSKMAKVVIQERDGIALPIGGSVFIGSTRIKVKNNYNIQASIKANAPIKHRNYDTDGHVAKIYYSQHLSKIAGRDRSIWAFKGHRDFRRALSKEYPKDWKKYLPVESIYAIVKDFNRHRSRNYLQETRNKVEKTYNEFDL